MKANNTTDLDLELDVSKITDHLDSITISTADDTIDLSSVNSMIGSSTDLSKYSYQYTTGVPSITIGTSSGTNGTFNYSPYIINTVGSEPGLNVSGEANFEGDVKIKGRSLEKMLQKIEDRLAILSEPDPKKLEKFAALKKAYENYKMLERLIGEDSDPTEK